MSHPNVVDSLELMIPRPLEKSDFNSLRDQGFVRPGSGARPRLREEDEHFFGHLRDPGNSILVRARSDRVKVHMTLSNLCGKRNAFHEEVTYDEIKEAVLGVVRKFPETREKAKESFKALERFRGWGIWRMDVTRNFVGPVLAVIASYAHLHPRSMQRTEWTRGRQILFKGTRKQLAIYDKSRQAKVGPYGTLGRVEARWIGPKALTEVAAMLPDARQLTFWVRGLDGYPALRPVDRRLDFAILDRALQDRVRSLGPLPASSRRALSPDLTFHRIADVLADLLLRNPNVVSPYIDRLSTAAQGRVRAATQRIRAARPGRDLFALVPGWAAGSVATPTTPATVAAARTAAYQSD